MNEHDRMIQMFSDLGEGDFGRGINVARDNLSWLIASRKKSEKLSIAVYIFAATTFIGAIFSALWYGLKVLLLSGKSP